MTTNRSIAARRKERHEYDLTYTVTYDLH